MLEGEVPEEAVEWLLCGDDYTDDEGELFEHVATDVVDVRRWVEDMETVFRYKGALWMFEWERGRTESQENEVNVPMPCVEVEPYTVLTTRYSPVGEG